MIFATKKLIAKEKITLTSATFISHNYGHNPALGGAGLLEIVLNITESPNLFLSDSLRNAFYFLSPFSGSGARGHGWHNISVFVPLDRAGFVEFSKS